MPEQLHGDSLEASLTVRDLARSVAWYTDVLGFAVDRKYDRDGKMIAVSLKAALVRILLTQDDGAKGLDRSKGDGMSLQITTHQSADTLAAAVRPGFRFTISSTQAA